MSHCWAQPLRHACGVPPLLVGEALAGRVTSCCLLKAQYNAKNSALLQRAAASEQYPCQAAASLGSRALFFALY